jgi:hypothetical protein
MIGRFYSWFWFHTEFWLTPVDRRPYTFIMRDWIYPHADCFAAMVLVWYLGMMLLEGFHPYIAGACLIVSSALIAHLVWGSKWIEGQQEFPEYNPDE